VATTVITGKSATFSYGSTAGTAQITTFTPDESSSPETIETLGGTAVLSSTKERTVEVEALFDGDQVGGGFYKVVKDAFDGGTSGALAVAVGAATWAGQGIVSALSSPTPADGAVTITVTFTLDSWTYTAPVA
jgi:hypothetical protein